ncbi:kunitz-type protease inhibitor 3-like [Globicephala melas]|uniref:kunitz-type protease inhibitor 3-like n=2 Tax=Delphinidae TaxID=9726 RepID=UPI00293D9E88|nr:kunitz-type protease inhibitor 3-like [Globicephala melas]
MDTLFQGWISLMNSRSQGRKSWMWDQAPPPWSHFSLKCQPQAGHLLGGTMQLWVSPSLLLLFTFCQELRSELRQGWQSCLRKFYNWRTYECELFYYGGCNGNGNNFLRKAACEKTCKNT